MTVFHVQLAATPAAVLLYLSEHGPASASEVSSAVTHGRGTYSHGLGLLHGLGLVAATDSGRLWALTAEGERVVAGNASENTQSALREVLSTQVIRHPLPWRIRSDWTEEVVASDGYCIAKCRDPEDAEAIIAAVNPLWPPTPLS